MHIAKKYLSRYVGYFTPSHLYYDYGCPEQTVLVAGSARSGTTYFTKLVNADNNFRYIFEPFHPGQCLYMAGLPDTPYLRPNEKNERYQLICQSIFKGDIRSQWVNKFNKRYISRQRIVKSIRMLMALGWIHKHFPAIPIIYLMRHPLAVVASRLKIAEKYPDWFKLDLHDLFTQSNLIKDYPDIYETIRSSNFDEFQSQVVYWSVLNKIALDQLESINHKMFFYEQCLIEPETVFLNARQFIECYWADTIDQTTDIDTRKGHRIGNVQMQIKKTAGFSFKSMSGNSTEARMQGWRNQFNKQQVDFTNHMLKEFGLDTYYDAKQTLPVSQ